jgi:spectinomycin phosphotransferase
MLTPLAQLSAEKLTRCVAEGFETGSDAPAFLPVGEDSWAYRIGDLWVSVRRDLRGYSPAAYELARRLRKDGAEYVLSPLLWPDGCIARMVEGYPVLVFPYVEAEEVSRETVTPDELAEVSCIFRRLHGSALQTDLLAEAYTLSFEWDILAVISAHTSRPSDRGPYTARFLDLISAWHAELTAELEELTELANLCRHDQTPFVLTHGEPCASNILRTAAGLRLIDWGEAAWGPRERDLFHLRRTLGPIPGGRPHFLRFYEIRWRLSEIAEYGMRFLNDHTGDADDLAMWHRLLHYLPSH